MHKTVANKTGGTNVELTPAEEEKTMADWARNAAEQAAEQAAEKLEREEAEKGLDTLTADLPPAEAAALKRMLNV